MKYFFASLLFAAFFFGCKKNNVDNGGSPFVLAKDLTGTIDLPATRFPNIVVSSEVDTSLVSVNGTFNIATHSVLLAKDTINDKPVYFGCPGTDEVTGYILNAKETALYYSLAALPNIRRPYYRKAIKKIKQALYQYQEVENLEKTIKNCIAQKGYLDYNIIGGDIGKAVDRILTNIKADEKSYDTHTVTNSVIINPTYAATGGFYRVDTAKPSGWQDVYNALDSSYNLERKMFNSTPAVVGVQMGKYDATARTAHPDGKYVGFIQPYYLPDITSIDGNVANFEQTMQQAEDIWNNGLKDGLNNTDAYSEGNTFKFTAKENSKDAVCFINGYYDPKVMQIVNIAYLFIDNFQDVYETLSSNKLYSKKEFINDFINSLVTDVAANASDLSNYYLWFNNRDYILIIASLQTRLHDFIRNQQLDFTGVLLAAIDKNFKDIAGAWADAYTASSICYKILSNLIVSNSIKFAGALPIQFDKLHLPPLPTNPYPLNINLGKVSAVNFKWAVNNPTNQAISYNLYLSNDINDISRVPVATGITSTNYTLNNLSYADTRCYWQIEAINSSNEKVISPIWSFDVGSYPFIPVLSNSINITSIDTTSALTDAEFFINDGGGAITAKGFCWSTSPNPTINDQKTNEGSGTLFFYSHIRGLKPNTTYYIRAYGTNATGTAYGGQTSFLTKASSINNSTATDIDGNVYHTVTIGTQTWMVENLKTTHYQNGELIPNVTDSAQWGRLRIGAYCNQNNDSTTSNTGRLYNWYAVNDMRNLPPSGWHVPTETEALILESNLNNTGNNFINQKFQPFFTGLRTDPGGFINNINYCVWWEATVYSLNNYMAQTLYYSVFTNFQNGSVNGINAGLTVRCIKN